VSVCHIHLKLDVVRKQEGRVVCVNISQEPPCSLTLLPPNKLFRRKCQCPHGDLKTKC
jgi:hypothetical protein